MSLKIILPYLPGGNELNALTMELHFSRDDPYISFIDTRISIPEIVTRNNIYRKTCNMNGTLVGNKIFDDSDEVGASTVGAAPTTSSF